MLKSGYLALAAVLMQPAASRAETEIWSRMAEIDLGAARDLIAASHPGAVPSHSNKLFLRALNEGYADALAEGRKARTYAAYRTTLSRFAAGFGDGHISSYPTLRSESRWPGFLVALDGDAFKVATRIDGDGPPLGARLLSCDGRDPAALLEAMFAPISPNWSVRAQRAKATALLFIDDASSLRILLKTCTFECVGGRQVSHLLAWQSL